MPGKQPKREADLSEKEKEQVADLKKQINDLPDNNPKLCEGLIREKYDRISEISRESEKKLLMFELKAVSCRGLDTKLREMVEANGLILEALHLLLKYLTTKEELAQYFFSNRKGTVEDDNLDVVKKRLGPMLEVTGGLSAKGIDVKKLWVQNLINAAPSLQSLSQISVGRLEVR